jgi:hypothetical protein
MEMTIDQVGIVPPWLGDDVPHIMKDDGNYLPVLPIPPSPPGWDARYQGPPLDDGVPDPDDRDYPWKYSFGYPSDLGS